MFWVVFFPPICWSCDNFSKYGNLTDHSTKIILISSNPCCRLASVFKLPTPWSEVLQDRGVVTPVSSLTRRCGTVLWPSCSCRWGCCRLSVPLHVSSLKSGECFYSAAFSSPTRRLLAILLFPCLRFIFLLSLCCQRAGAGTVLTGTGQPWCNFHCWLLELILT